MHFPIAPGFNWIVPSLPCTLQKGWVPVHKVEADASGNDRFAAQTCVVLNGQASFFLPSTLDDLNKVHVFFSAGMVDGDQLNHVAIHALRSAAEAAGWIVISVAYPQRQLITALQIRELLLTHGRGMAIDKLRLSSHSRGAGSMAAAIASNQLVSKNGDLVVVPASTVDRVVSFDTKPELFLGAVAASGIDLEVLFGFHANAATPSTDLNHGKIYNAHTIDLLSDPIVMRGVRAVEYLRLVNDAATLQPGLSVPSDVAAAATALPLPDLGRFTTRVPLAEAAAGAMGSTGFLPGALELVEAAEATAGQSMNFKTFCRLHESIVEKLVGQEVKLAGNSALFDFVAANDLGHVAPKEYSPGIAHHEFFVAEFAHEVTDVEEPTPG